MIGALLPIVAWIIGTIAIVLGLTVRKEARRRGAMPPWQATAGLALGAFGVVLGIANAAAGVIMQT